MTAIPTRKEALEMAEQLLKGTKTPEEVSSWATAMYTEENQLNIDKLENEDPILLDFLNSLGMADIVGTMDGTKVYGMEDYVSWVDEFKKSIQIEN